MSAKKLKIFVIVLLSTVVLIFIITRFNQSSIHDSIINSVPEQYSNVRFFKDYLRDDGDLNLKLTDKNDVIDFVSALKTIKSTSHQIKTLENIVWYKIQ